MSATDNNFDELTASDGPARAPAGNGGSINRTLTIDALRGEGFNGFLTFEELRLDASAVPSSAGGAYVVVRQSTEAPGFLEESCGGHFKGRNPTEIVDVLERKWVPDAQIVYIGKGDLLQRRLKQYARFGAGRPVGHLGGRYIWQLANSGELRVAWKACANGETATQLEAKLVGRFKQLYGRLPFANIADPSGSR